MQLGIQQKRLKQKQQKDAKIGKKSTVEMAYKIDNIPSKDMKIRANDNIPSAGFIDEIINETKQVLETKFIYSDVVDQAYLEEYKSNIGENDGFVQNLESERKKLAEKSQQVNYILEKEQKIIEKKITKQIARLAFQNRKKTKTYTAAELRRMRGEVIKTDEIMEGYTEFHPVKKLVSNLGDLPSYQAIEQARRLPNSKVTESIREKERRAYAAKKIRERKIKLGLIIEETLPEVVKPSRILASQEVSKRPSLFSPADQEKFTKTFAMNFDLVPKKIKTDLSAKNSHKSMVNFRKHMQTIEKQKTEQKRDIISNNFTLSMRNYSHRLNISGKNSESGGYFLNQNSFQSLESNDSSCKILNPENSDQQIQVLKLNIEGSRVNFKDNQSLIKTEDQLSGGLSTSKTHYRIAHSNERDKIFQDRVKIEQLMQRATQENIDTREFIDGQLQTSKQKIGKINASMKLVNDRFRELSQYSGKVLNHFYKHRAYVDRDYETEKILVINQYKGASAYQKDDENTISMGQTLGRAVRKNRAAKDGKVI